MSNISESRLDHGQCSVIVLHYRGLADTLACLASLLRLEALPRRIVVVANGGTDTPALLAGWTQLARQAGLLEPVILSERDALPATRLLLLTLPENRGFSGGNNAGLALALRDPGSLGLWLLNNDTEVHAQALAALCRRLNEVPKAGCCGSTLVYAHAPDRVQCAAGCTLSSWTGASAFVCGNVAFAKIHSLPPEVVEARLGYLCGASMLVRRETLERVGLLPEEYFLYYEDAAWSVRVRRAGFALAWAPASLVRHKEGGASGASGARSDRPPARDRFIDYLSQRNRIHLIKHFFPLRLPVALAAVGGVLLRRLGRGQADRIGLVLQGAWHGLIGRMGRPRGDL